MGRNSSGLHLKIAEWILERGEAACVYDVVKQFGVTIRQAIGLLSSVVTDSAIETRTGLIIPDRPNGRYNGKHVRSVSVLSIDHETISRRKKHTATTLTTRKATSRKHAAKCHALRNGNG
uniref:hypothetical protein n=1 Tax=Salmonella enterica TaxID=28901 RepID=UPI003A8E2D26